MASAAAAAAEGEGKGGAVLVAKILTPEETGEMDGGEEGKRVGEGVNENENEKEREQEKEGEGARGGGAQSSSLRVTPKEYLGGAMDLTGEVGRFAVAAATRRDTAAVRCCLSSLYFVQNEVVPLAEMAGLGSKCGALRSSISKLEKILYEQSLVD